ncbi:MAG TPA: hypothetical protein VGD01_17800 [Candidatus Elarobacter sp.]
MFAGCTIACGCGGGGGGSPAQLAPPPAPTATPTAPPGGPLTLSRTAAAFTLAGETVSVAASETGYTGTVTPDAGGCANVAGVSPSSASAPAAFTVTALGAGACTIAFSDRFGQRATVSVGVTITQGSIR